MVMIYELTHSTTYEYNGPVSLSQHVLRLQPRDLAQQRCLQHGLQIDPASGVVHSHTDYFGNKMTFVTVEGAHKKLVMTSHSRVELDDAVAPPEAGDTPAWETVRDFCLENRPNGAGEAREFIYASPQIQRQDAFAAYAAPSFTPGQPILGSGAPSDRPDPLRF